MTRKPFVEQVDDMPGPWWLYLVGVYTGIGMAVDFARYVPDSHGMQQLGNLALALAGVLATVGSVTVALVKRRRRPLDRFGRRA